MLKSFHLGHVREARAEAFSQSEMKVIQVSKTQEKEYSTTIVSLRNIEMR